MRADPIALVVLKSRGGSVKALAVIDVEDVERVSKLDWWLASNGYANTRRDGKVIGLHRFVTGAPDGLSVDHVDHDLLNCRKANLRVVTHAQNQQNRQYGYGTSKHRGVSWNTRRQKWVAQVKINGQGHFLGAFDDELEAARVAADFRREHMPFSAEAA